MDTLSPEKRSWNMSRIKSHDTKPEIRVRSLLHRMGYRFRIYKKNLPGSPDIVLSKYKIIIFVHGCFWHQHEGCKKAYSVKSNVEKWETKFKKNIARDTKVRKKLIDLGWDVYIIWECETKNERDLVNIINKIFLQNK